MAVGSDVGPFPHGTQARELVLMVKVWDAAAGSDTGGPAEWSGNCSAGRDRLGAGGGLSGRCDRGFGRPTAGYWGAGKCIVCDEGWGSLQEVNRCELQRLKANCECRVYDMPEGISRYESSLNPIYLDPIYLDPIYPDPALPVAVSRIFGIVFRPSPGLMHRHFSWFDFVCGSRRRLLPTDIRVGGAIRTRMPLSRLESCGRRRMRPGL